MLIDFLSFFFLSFLFSGEFRLAFLLGTKKMTGMGSKLCIVSTKGKGVLKYNIK